MGLKCFNDPFDEGMKDEDDGIQRNHVVTVLSLTLSHIRTKSEKRGEMVHMTMSEEYDEETDSSVSRDDVPMYISFAPVSGIAILELYD